MKLYAPGCAGVSRQGLNALAGPSLRDVDVVVAVGGGH